MCLPTKQRTACLPLAMSSGKAKVCPHTMIMSLTQHTRALCLCPLDSLLPPSKDHLRPLAAPENINQRRKHSKRCRAGDPSSYQSLYTTVATSRPRLPRRRLELVRPTPAAVPVRGGRVLSTRTVPALPSVTVRQLREEDRLALAGTVPKPSVKSETNSSSCASALGICFTHKSSLTKTSA